MALHSGPAEEREGDYFGPTLNRVARLLATGHGGQILLSQAAYDLVRDHLDTLAGEPTGGSLGSHKGMPLPSVTVRDLGEYRLKDLTRPEHVYQVVATHLPADFPPLHTLDVRPHNLPPQPTPLIGREAETRHGASLLQRPEVRLVTLTGPGGMGKTRLALQVAAEMLDQFPHGVYFVNLAPISDPALVIPTIAQALDLREAGDRPLVDVLRDYVRGKQMLLVLDNFEQVVQAASQVAALLADAPRLKLLVTSRIALRLRAEHEYPVPPLGLPPKTEDSRLKTGEQASVFSLQSSTITQYEAVRLFIERAQAVKPDFEVTNENAPAVAEICYRLDGLPLAIELAAARVRLLPPQAMLHRLGNRLKLLTGGAADLPQRQQTLRNAITWSYDLLNEGEQTLFRRLGVFVGGWTLAAAEAVCNAAGDLRVDVLDGIESLVAKSLVRQTEGIGGEPRFTLLETIREYALERLAESDELEVVKRQHTSFFLSLAEEAEPRLCSSDQMEWLERLEADYDNLRTALAWGKSEPNEAEIALKLAGALSGFWFWRAYLSEGHSWLADALTRPPHPYPTATRAKALCGAGALAWGIGDFLTARDWLEESVAIRRELRDRHGLAESLHYLGHAIMETDREAARVLFEESVSLFRAVGDKWSLALTRYCMGGVVVVSDQELARACYEESLSLWRMLGDKSKLALPLAELGRVALEEGDYAAARRLFEEGLSILRETGLNWGVAEVLNNLGDVARCLRNYEQARLHYEESLALWRDMSNKGGAALSLNNLAHVALAQGDTQRAGALLKESLSLTQTLSKAAIARSLAGFARLAALKQPKWAAELIGAVNALLAATRSRLDPADRLEYDQTVLGIRNQLDENTWTTTVAEGAMMTLERAIALAMAQPDDP